MTKEIRGADYANLALDVIKNIKEEVERLNGGPSFYFEKMGTYVRALFERFAPFKPKDRVMLVEDIPMTDTNYGWHRCAHFLKKGETALVEYVDYNDRLGFIADCIFDNETFKDEMGNLIPVTNRHLFSISEKWLKKVD